MWNKLRRGLERTRQRLWSPLDQDRSALLDVDAVADLEAMLLSADVGPEICEELLAPLRPVVSTASGISGDDLRRRLADGIAQILTGADRTILPITVGPDPRVFLIVGVNGSGKTTTVVKMGRLLADSGLRVLLAAADTFRAAAIEQLSELARRTGLDVVAHRAGADPGAVAHDAVEHARSRSYDVVLIDTAGRLQTKRPLMEELGKVVRVVERLQGRVPDERILVVDASVGQNAVSQADLFHEAVGLTGMVITKLDGTAKGGAVLPIWRQLRVPILWLGVGEGLDDLERFSAEAYANALTGR